MKEDLKIIFLDIDGVLNTQSWISRSKGGNRDVDLIDPELVQNLNSIIRSTGAKIVLSSSWRIGRKIEEIKTLFKKIGIEGELLGVTPRLYYTTSDSTVPRGCEIQEWLERNTDSIDWRNYVIIDDDSDMLYEHRANYFKTDFSGGGLTRNIAWQVKHFLNGYHG